MMLLMGTSMYVNPEQRSGRPFVAALAYVLITTALVCVMLAAGFDDASWMTLLLINGGFAIAYHVVEGH